ncbi:energy transducer TonB [Sphingobium subterraneum]|uniref:Protein TonB n=1 Tax=Sphingobium subterraneum TaxID=627688 RepID=A0A841IVW3_9SPHN|nr:energy transducer TonB [Sphingobium subterraneum]MBB6122400.1 protein TonB [Sphingobium subterraneum]
MAAALTQSDRRTWGGAAALAATAHAAFAALVLLWSRPAQPPLPEPVVLIELPPEGAPAPAVSAQKAVVEPRSQLVPPQTVTPPVDIPPVRAPLPRDPVTLPPPLPPLPTRVATPVQAPAVAQSAPAATAPTGSTTSTSTTPGSDPKAKRAEADYFSLISAHLNRRKTYPTEAKKARQEGVVTVRFTVARDGSVSNISLRRGSGHELLDTATLQLLQRVAPLPRMPASMQRDSITLSLPIDYSLRTN